MTRPISSVSLPGTIPSYTRARPPLSAPVPLELPTLRTPGGAGGPRLSIAVLDAGGRLQDRGAVAALGWSTGDRLLITLVQTSVVIHRRADGVFVMPRKPYVCLPATVRRACGVDAGARMLLVADSEHDALVVHPEPAVQAMLRTFHATLATTEEAS
ncbi:hypothetical protein [Amycolatopsis azurea]|uniref:hypothetical protein n=1 Tax=Amycolatopsis azurea TaxID=36819 RepID=UPI001FD766D2|nr:hypothetical protein [Amycolatopsis azurea]